MMMGETTRYSSRIALFAADPGRWRSRLEVMIPGASPCEQSMSRATIAAGATLDDDSERLSSPGLGPDPTPPDGSGK